MSSIITTALPTAVRMDAVDISGQWGKLWGAITSAAPSLSGILSAVGALLVIAALIMWIIKRRTQRGMGDMTAVWGALIIGAVFLAPAVVIPLALTLIDLVVNIVVGLGQTVVR